MHILYTSLTLNLDKTQSPLPISKIRYYVNISLFDKLSFNKSFSNTIIIFPLIFTIASLFAQLNSIITVILKH